MSGIAVQDFENKEYLDGIRDEHWIDVVCLGIGEGASRLAHIGIRLHAFGARAAKTW